jgi:ABC-type phosphate/phosphonate transport system substrate-binding protein
MTMFIFVSTVSFAGPKTLKFGVYPYVSASKLIKHQAVVHQFLRKQLNNDIDFVTAQDFKSYAAHVQNSDYDLIFAAPHFARYCAREGLYIPLALTQTKIQGVYLVNKDSPLQTLEDLRGQALSISSVGLRFGLLHQIMKNQTKALAIDKLRYVEARTNNNSIYALLKKEIDVALTGINIWKNIKPAERSQLRIIGETPKVSGFVIMARPSLANQIRPLFSQVDKDFADLLAGKKYIFRGLKPYSENMLQDMDPYTRPFDQFKQQ